LREFGIWYNCGQNVLRIYITAVIAIAVAHFVRAEDRVVRTIPEALGLGQADFTTPVRFELRGQLLSTLNGSNFIIEDNNRQIKLTFPADRHIETSGEIKIGDIVLVRGHTMLLRGFFNCFMVESAITTGHRNLPSPIRTTIGEILDGQHDLKLVNVCGEVTAVFKDDITSEWQYCIMRDGDKVIYLAVLDESENPRWTKRIVGATVEAAGLCGYSLFGLRKFIRPGVCAESPDAIRIVKEAPDPFEVPELENPQSMSIDDVMRLGRRKVRGRVIASWSGNRILARTAEGRIVRADLSQESTRPEPGDEVCVAGAVTTDFFRLNLEDAVVRRLPPGTIPKTEESVVEENRFLADIVLLKNKVHYLGKTVRTTGIVNRIFQTGDSEMRFDIDTARTRMTVEANPMRIPVDAISQGCKIQVVGTFVTEGDNWRLNAPFPRIREWSLVVNDPSGIAVLERPPWWSARRLVVLVSVLFAVLVASFVWIYALRLLANRRGRALFKEQIARADAQLRVEERTRLATELHDSLSQNLSGIACQINVAKLTAGDDETRKLLTTAERMLQSSRTELTRCIGDLRCDTLEDPDFSAAISKNLDMLALPADIRVRLDIPRHKISDSTAHSILCIVRELVTNAVRHGKATTVEVSGDMDEHNLSFSVIDDGCGFDIAGSPGVNEGHFGLAGIRDRVNRLGGTFEIDTAPGRGTKATINLELTERA